MGRRKTHRGPDDLNPDEVELCRTTICFPQIIADIIGCRTETVIAVRKRFHVKPVNLSTRTPRGPKKRPLTHDVVRFIRDNPHLSLKKLALKYNRSVALISAIRTGRLYKHVKPKEIKT